MKRAGFTAAQVQEQFWYAVAESLRLFHNKQAQFVTAAISQIRSKVGSMSKRTKEMFYHSEPFDVACDLAGRKLDVKEYLPRYLQIRDVEAEKVHLPKEGA